MPIFLFPFILNKRVFFWLNTKSEPQRILKNTIIIKNYRVIRKNGERGNFDDGLTFSNLIEMGKKTGKWNPAKK